MGTLLAWAVHLYTASSAVFGLWAIDAIYSGEYRLAMYLMLLTMAIDATDGMWARRVRVKERIPWVDGRRLDDICDFFTYVLVPASMLIQAHLLPHPIYAALPVLASGYGFSQADAKTSDDFFLGFPSYWNVAVMYLYLMEASPSTALWIIAALSAGVFVPTRYIYPTRTRALRPLSMAMMAIWGLAFAWLAVRPDPDSRWLLLTLAIGPGYYLALSFILHFVLPRDSGEATG
jgi:phosphatidylcholine synthase